MWKPKLKEDLVDRFGDRWLVAAVAHHHSLRELIGVRRLGLTHRRVELIRRPMSLNESVQRNIY